MIDLQDLLILLTRQVAVLEEVAELALDGGQPVQLRQLQQRRRRAARQLALQHI